MQLNAVDSRSHEGFGGVRLGEGGVARQLVGPVIETPGAVIDQGFEGLGVHVHFREGVFDSLVLANGPIELNPLLRVVHRDTQRLVHGAPHFGGDSQGAGIEQALEVARSACRTREDGFLRNMDVIEFEVAHALGRVDHGEGLGAHARGIGFDDGQPEIPFSFAAPKGDYEKIGGFGVHDAAFLPGEPEACSIGLAYELDVFGGEGVAVFQECQGADRASIGKPRKPLLLLGLIACLDKRGGGQGMTEQRRG